MYSFKSPSFLPPFSLRWVVLGISCHVPFALISRVWQPLFTFLHLYFGPCSRDVGIYFPPLCACIAHDVCIYIHLLAPSGVTFIVHVTKAKRCLISAAEVRWHVTGVSPWKFGTLPEYLEGTTPIQKPNLKAPHACKALKANAKIMFFITNLRKLWFYQNKGLSLDRCCGVPNTFLTSN